MLPALQNIPTAAMNVGMASLGVTTVVSAAREIHHGWNQVKLQQVQHNTDLVKGLQPVQIVNNNR